MTLQMLQLLANGYFPKELPPPFSTISYALALSAPGVSLPSTFLRPPKKIQQASSWCNHNLARAGGLRRHLGIPNPVQFYRLAHLIVTHWKELEAQADASPYSLSKPVTIGADRAISPSHDLGERPIKRAELRIGSRFVLHVDISRFFPSVYTHALPWALLGKPQAKQLHVSRQLSGTWEDDLDSRARALNGNQTVGIPIGPDTSRLLAEVILGRIDSELSQRVPGIKGFRYIDDYEFATETRSDAETVLHALQELLAQFELAPNAAKTHILELPVPLEHFWMGAIRSFVFRGGNATTQKNDLIGYFDIVFDLLKRFPDETLLKYAIGRLRGVDVRPDNWKLFQHILNQCVLVDPACIAQVCDQIAHYIGPLVDLAPETRLWEATLNQVICEHLPIGHASECAWAMWLMKLLSCRLSASSVAAVDATDDSVSGLMGLGLLYLGLGPSPSHALTGLRRFCSPTELFEGRWLMCYQGSLMNWLDPSTSASVLTSDPRFEYLASQQASFFDVSVDHPTPSRTAPGSGSGGGGGGGGSY